MLDAVPGDRVRSAREELLYSSGIVSQQHDFKKRPACRTWSCCSRYRKLLFVVEDDDDLETLEATPR